MVSPSTSLRTGAASEFDATATSFENPDWAEVVIHSYRHRWGYAKGDPALDALERRLTPPPLIFVPTLVLQGADDPCNSPVTSENKERFFSGRYQRKLLSHVGHFPQRENGCRRNSQDWADRSWRVYDYGALVARDKASLDIFGSGTTASRIRPILPPPEVIAREIVEDLEAALDLG